MIKPEEIEFVVPNAAPTYPASPAATATAAPAAGKSRGYAMLVVTAIIALVSLTAFSVVSHNSQVADTPAGAGHAADKIKIKCARVKAEDSTSNLSLPADIQAMQSSTIFARVNGYLKIRSLDIGTDVKKGQIIAEIDTPELDQQLAEAEATLVQAQANVENAEAIYKKSLTDMESVKSTIDRNAATVQYAKNTYHRWQALQQEGAVSMQDRDTQLTNWQTGNADLSSSISAKASAEAQIAANKAAILVAKANEKASAERVKELRVTQQFKKVTAPFDGTITNRLVDAGQLISSGGGTGSTQLFTIVDQRRLRIYVQVPERNVATLKVGMPVKIAVETFPHEEFTGTMTNVSGGLDVPTRTMQVEIQMDNSAKKLHAGMFATAKLSMTSEDRSVLVPAAAIVVKNADTCVELLDKSGKLHWQPVVVSKEMGRLTAVTSGITDGDFIVASPNDDYIDNNSIALEREAI